MGIQAQIDRIKNNVTRSLAKVAEKGVTVPADVNSDDLEGLIDAITGGGGGGSGGGLPDGVSALASGEYVPSSDIASRAFVDHGLSVTPNFCFWFMEDAVTAVPETAILMGFMGYKQHPYSAAYPDVTFYCSFMFWGYNSGKNSVVSGSGVAATNYFTATQVALCGNATMKLKAGYKYRWVCGVIDGIQ